MPKAMRIELIIVLAILLAATALFRFTDLDLYLQGLCYDATDEANDGWKYAENKPWSCLYNCGNYPALLLAVAALTVLALGYRYKKLLKWRKIAFFFIIVMLIGPGLLINMVFKDHWGRPRPREVVEFGGESAFEPVWDTGVQGKGKSFPCGHCSMGFFLLAPWFVLRKSRRLAAVGVLLLGLTAGGLIGAARVAQGGHFPSDVLWSLGMVYIVAMCASYILKFDRNIWFTTVNEARKSVMLWIISPAILVLIFLVLLATPYYRKKERRWKHPLPERISRFDIVSPRCDINLIAADTLFVSWEANGFGLPNAAVRDELRADTTATGVNMRFSQRVEGLYTELTGDVTVFLPITRIDTIYVASEKGSIRLLGPDWETEAKAFEMTRWELESDLHVESGAVLLWDAPEGRFQQIKSIDDYLGGGE